ncbi:glutamate--cysteine ligase [Nodosilinea sp. LEGE 07088]|uniref:glutamate--cysteine ligase n=1 Tax=Nodosilinea sp. LEGE 07088 TaxID=2777968 RepID=UPI001881F555|nr:glutamate--cysteine ligase [Nodosilinea sp. LEGE 07088]MBE9136340.1 glutamate--cysteine ligase [Nodosilinea sp. LEGE 07088]
MLLSKGFEIEMYTGTPAGEIIGLSDRIVADLNGFVREPDSRNVEYTTPPLCQYEKLLCELVRPRHELRQYLQGLGDYTLIPGSTLSLGPTDRFYRSDPGNPYHTYIEQTYGTTVVTASVHINIGISDPEILMRACRLMRVEAPLYLALTAASPFLGGRLTGSHSSRWQVFPKTPAHVPLFTSHAHHIQWTEAQLATGAMQNVRHLWSAVRPNGDRRPYNLNRLELRICDLISDPVALLAVTALIEARLHQLIQTPDLDPLVMSTFPMASRNDDLVALSDANEAAAAQQSLDAELRHWQDGRPLLAREWIHQLYEEVWPIAKANGISCFLSPVKKILREGNEAQRWLQQHDAGQSIEQVVQGAIADVAHTEAVLARDLCVPCAA